jgi:hypothetical protein
MSATKTFTWVCRSAMAEDIRLRIQLRKHGARTPECEYKMCAICLDDEYQRVAHFTEAVINCTGLERELGDRVKDAFGEKAFLEISLAIATSRFYPMIKGALGYSTESKMERFRV